jgi:hypothetical protein
MWLHVFLHAVHTLERLVVFWGRTTHLEECWESRRRALSSRWHGSNWNLVWKLVLDLRTLRLMSDHVGVVDPGIQMDFDGLLEHWIIGGLWRRIFGHLLWRVHLGTIVWCSYIPRSLTYVT